MKFVLIHGAYGSPEGNWFPDFKERLLSLGQDVFVPLFPVEDWDEITKKGKEIAPTKQTLTNWLKVFEPISKSFVRGEKICFVGHSLGPVFILHAVNHFDIQLDSAIFVSPFLDALPGVWQFDQVNASFYKTDFDFEKLKKRIPISYVLYSNNDPYVPVERFKEFATCMKSSCIEIRGGGHLNSEFGYTTFPLVTELCKTRIDHSVQ